MVQLARTCDQPLHTGSVVLRALGKHVFLSIILSILSSSGIVNIYTVTLAIASVCFCNSLQVSQHFRCALYN